MSLINEGDVFGRLEVIHRMVAEDGSVSWLCKCDCGRYGTAKTSQLVKGIVKSCGCGARSSFDHPLYGVWVAMIGRCTNPKHPNYKDYGGRGITVCQRWLSSFRDFVEDMGDRDNPEMTIDRIDNDKGYSKDNCRWATRVEQANNKRSTHWITYNGVRDSLTNHCRALGISRAVIFDRIRRGATFEEAVSKPVRPRRAA
jgi:hypothetical protein